MILSECVPSPPSVRLGDGVMGNPRMLVGGLRDAVPLLVPFRGWGCGVVALMGALTL